MIKGIDFSYGGGITAEQIKAAGYQFVGRYLTGLDGNTKDIGASELGGYVKGSVSVVFAFERQGQEFTEADGVADAKAAQAQLDDLGAAVARADVRHAKVFFAQDIPEAAGVDPTGYMRGVCSVIGVKRCGIYGDFATVKACFDAGVVAYGWQTSGGSGGEWDARALLRQDRYGVHVGPAVCDVDQAAFWSSATVLTDLDDFGQFPTPAPKPKPKPVPSRDARYVSDGKLTLHQAARSAGCTVEAVVLCTLRHADHATLAALLAYLGIGDWSGRRTVRRSHVGANAVMPKGRVVFWMPAK